MSYQASAFTRLVRAFQGWLNDVESEQGLGWPSDWSVVQYDIDRARAERDYQAAARRAARDWGISYGASASPPSYLMSSASPPVTLLDIGVISRAEARGMLEESAMLAASAQECGYCGVAAPRNPDHTCMGCGAPDKDARLCRYCGRSQAGHTIRCLGCGAHQSGK